MINVATTALRSTRGILPRTVTHGAFLLRLQRQARRKAAGRWVGVLLPGLLQTLRRSACCSWVLSPAVGDGDRVDAQALSDVESTYGAQQALRVDADALHTRSLADVHGGMRPEAGPRQG